MQLWELNGQRAVCHYVLGALLLSSRFAILLFFDLIFGCLRWADVIFYLIGSDAWYDNIEQLSAEYVTVT